jgi:hypothetical protein
MQGPEIDVAVRTEGDRADDRADSDGGGDEADNEEDEGVEGERKKARARVREGVRAGGAIDVHDTPTTHDGHDPITLAAAATDRMNKLGMKARRGIPDSEVRRTKATRDKYMKKSMPLVSDGRSNKKQNWVPKYQDETQTRTSNDLGPYFRSVL